MNTKKMYKYFLWLMILNLQKEERAWVSLLIEDREMELKRPTSDDSVGRWPI